MKNKIIYQAYFVAKDKTKEYPHGFGFAPPLIEMPQDADEVFCSDYIKKHLSSDEFSCVSVIPVMLRKISLPPGYPKQKP